MSNNDATRSYYGLIHPEKVWSCPELLTKDSPIPRTSGAYAWYFRELPHASIPTEDCVVYEGLTLLYSGISPKPTSMGGRPSAQNLAKRIRGHLTGNAEGSTLRLSLGCLLSEKLGITLRRVGSGKRMTFAQGEIKLSEWMAQNAHVVWVTHETPWLIEGEMIRNVSLPLNLDQNKHHAFHQVLTSMRRNAKTKARELPVLIEV